MSRIFAIGDIHGCNKTFRKLLAEKIRIQKSDTIICIGDYIDRGHDSKGVVDFILQLQKEGYQIHTLRGNHEELLMGSTESDKNFKHWVKNGGDATLKSFRVSSYDKLNPVYRNFFKRTKYFILDGKFIFVHAGLNFQVQNPLKDKYSMLWIRDSPIDRNKLNGKVLIHGHTPKPLSFLSSQKFEYSINIDGGCVYKHSEGLGFLCALNIIDKKLIAIRNIDEYNLGL